MLILMSPAVRRPQRLRHAALPLMVCDLASRSKHCVLTATRPSDSTKLITLRENHFLLVYDPMGGVEESRTISLASQTSSWRKMDALRSLEHATALCIQCKVETALPQRLIQEVEYTSNGASNE